MLPVSASAYTQAGAERKSDPICQRVGGGGICRHPRRESSSGPSARSLRMLMVMCWEYFGAIVLNYIASGYMVSCSFIFPYSSLSQVKSPLFI